MTDAYLHARNGDAPREVTYVMPVWIILCGLDRPIEVRIGPNYGNS